MKLCTKVIYNKIKNLKNRSPTIVYSLVIIYIISYAEARHEIINNCSFPEKWEGSWFLSGYQQSIHVKGSLFSLRGKCIATTGNKYLLVDDRGCHRCLVIYEKHINVLQYKESECDGDSYYSDISNSPPALSIKGVINNERSSGHQNSRFSSIDSCTGSFDDPPYCKGRETLQNLCDQIPGDALLYSLFRESAEPVKCPLRGSYTFTYNRGHGECKYPVSNIDSCTEESKLLLNFQACPDIAGTESSVEELTCLATWRDGNSRYMLGLVTHHHATTNEDYFRCFVYEKITTNSDNPSMRNVEYKLAQSGDATCNGLDSAEVGSRIMTLRKPQPPERCDFPLWLKGPQYWHSLKRNTDFQFQSSNNGSMHIMKRNGHIDTKAYCEQINKQTPYEMIAVVHYTSGCKKGFMCMAFHKRDTHIAEIQMGQPVSRLEDACLNEHFDIVNIAFITLLASNTESTKCPASGLFRFQGTINPPNMMSRHKRNHYLSKKHNYIKNNSANQNIHAHHHAKHHYKFNIQENVEQKGFKFYSNATKKHLKNFIKYNESNDSINTTIRTKREVPECSLKYHSERQLYIGCSDEDKIDVKPKCNEGSEDYTCYGSWPDNMNIYIIVKNENTKHLLCLTYMKFIGNDVKIVIGNECYHNIKGKRSEYLISTNVTRIGQCGDTVNLGLHTLFNQNYFYVWLMLMIISLVVR